MGMNKEAQVDAPECCMVEKLRAATSRLHQGRDTIQMSEQHAESIRRGLSIRGDPFASDDILVLDGDDISVRVSVSRLPVTIGAGEDCTYQVSGLGISRQHIGIELEKPFIMITDLNSKNGLYLNGKRIDSDYICLGDEVGMGSLKLLVTRQ